MEPEALRVALYRSFADTGRAPATDELARSFGVPPAEATDALRALAAARHVVLDEHDRVVMANPFASIPLGFSVMGARTL